jgi:hypothetical protein
MDPEYFWPDLDPGSSGFEMNFLKVKLLYQIDNFSTKMLNSKILIPIYQKISLKTDKIGQFLNKNVQFKNINFFLSKTFL